MAKKTGTESDNAGEEKESQFDLETQLNDIAIKTEVRKGGAGGGRIISLDLANALKTKYDSDGAFAVPKVWLETKVGMDTEKPMKGRPNAIKKKLNRQHADIIGDGNIWHVGNSGDKFYAIGILEADSDEELKWKNPAEWKKEHPEDEGDT